MHRYLILIEPTATGFSTYAPDLPGCIASGASKLGVEHAMREAIALHLDGLREEGLPIPVATTSAAYVDLD